MEGNRLSEFIFGGEGGAAMDLVQETCYKKLYMPVLYPFNEESERKSKKLLLFMISYSI